MGDNPVDRLKEHVKVIQSSEVSVEFIREVLETSEGLWQPDNEFVGKAIQQIKEECEEDEGETFIKAWVVISHNSLGKEQERLIVATTKAFYRINYGWAQQKIQSKDRTLWSGIELINFGQFKYQSGMFPSLGKIALSKDIDKLYGFRIFYKDRPEKAPKLPFLVERYVDKCFRTFRPIIPDNMENDEEKAEYMQKITQEIVYTCLGLLRAECTEEIQNKWPSNEGQIDVAATRGIISIIHNKVGMGVKKDKAPVFTVATCPEGQTPIEFEDIDLDMCNPRCYRVYMHTPNTTRGFPNLFHTETQEEAEEKLKTDGNYLSKYSAKVYEMYGDGSRSLFPCFEFEGTNPDSTLDEVPVPEPANYRVFIMPGNHNYHQVVPDGVLVDTLEHAKQLWYDQIEAANGSYIMKVFHAFDDGSVGPTYCAKWGEEEYMHNCRPALQFPWP